MQAWYLLWLLIFYLVYASFEFFSGSGTNNDAPAGVPFPSTRRRMTLGLGVGGFGSIIAITALLPRHALLGMPMVQGALPCDVMLFFAGILARKNDWLVHRGGMTMRTIREQMDISVVHLRAIVTIEIVLLLTFGQLTKSNALWGIPFLLVAGVFNLDMSLAVVEFFQTNFNYETRATKAFLAKAAYGVYLIHPVVVILMTIAFIRLYEGLSGRTLDWDAPFKSSTPIDGWILFAGWIGGMACANAAVWPLAWCLKQIPCLQKIL